jgi:membrane protein DedA with SNARE-associated domain
MSIDYIIAKYGLLAVFLGITIQGETIVFIGGIFAHRGDFSFPLLVAVAIIGNMFSDNLFFNLGRMFGQPLLKVAPAIHKRVGKIKTMFNKRPFMIVLCFRFMVGFRITAPCVIGMTGYSRIKYMLMDLCSSTAWALTYATMGYAFGKVIDHYLDDAKKYELWIALIIGAVGIGAVVLHHHRHVMRRRKARQRLVARKAVKSVE